MQKTLHFTRRFGKTLISPRLSWIYPAVIRNDRPDDIIADLLSQSLVSPQYDYTCLAVDVWFLFDRRRQMTIRAVTEVDDPTIRVFLGVVIQAIWDVRSGRPCDRYSWVTDQPPGDMRCLNNGLHICAPDALEYLRDMIPICEGVMGISGTTIMGLVEKKNGSCESRSSQIIDYARQVSK